MGGGTCFRPFFITINAFYHLNAVQCHVMQKDLVQQVAVMGRRTDRFCCRDRQVIGLHAILRYDHAPIMAVCVGARTQEVCQLVNADIRAVPHNNKSGDLSMIGQPGD